MKIMFIEKRFNASSLEIIAQANTIIREYQAAGYSLTLRQLYYQFVARGLISNTLQSYKRIGSIVSDARKAGQIDWSTIEDRTRYLREPTHWDSPASIIDACARQFKVDLWDGQARRPEVWIEKDALVGVIEPVCAELRVPCFSCRGYASDSALFEAGRRLRDYSDPIVFHFGDHDPSGLDMSRDIEERVSMFAEQPIEIVRLALNMDQVDEYDPPNNPAKMTDSRADEYVAEFGDSSWELDALDPSVIERLIRDAIDPLINRVLWSEQEKLELEGRAALERVAAEL
jgi:hypothetical protein